MMFDRSAEGYVWSGVFVTSLAGVLLLGTSVKAAESRQAAGKNKAQPIVVTIVYDNNPLDKRMETAWGFACVVEGLSETILFDTGGKGKLLLANMAKAGFEPEQIHRVVLSHAHSDHTGGLLDFLKVNPKAKVFVPKAFAADFKQEVSHSGAELVETEGPVKVCDGAWTTGVLTQPLVEQGLCLETSAGPVVVTGCAHPGIAQMARAATSRAKKPVHAVLGGFHMSRASADQIDTVIERLKELGVQQVAPTHCSGDNTRRSMKEAFGDKYLPSGLGAKFVFRQSPKTSAVTTAER
ncbi:MAG: MBL fold metallo-hydrolase [Planctomycetes bacterium]|nr:MBL fold metallo-hydrolase [Planctomycetota bacterium]MBL7038487.1 MBL fold metallo-hydrolase [Pirellulaceae bacterium]